MTQETILIIVAVGVVALIIGLLIGKSMSGGNNHSVAQKAQEELAEYQAAVSEHFGKTADLVDNLTNSYKEVFDHLGSSARALLSEEEVNKHLQSRADKAVTLTYNGSDADTTKVDDEVDKKVAENGVAKKIQKDASEVVEDVKETTEEAVDDTKKKAEAIADKVESVTEKTDKK